MTQSNVVNNSDAWLDAHELRYDWDSSTSAPYILAYADAWSASYASALVTPFQVSTAKASIEIKATFDITSMHQRWANMSDPNNGFEIQMGNGIRDTSDYTRDVIDHCQADPSSCVDQSSIPETGCTPTPELDGQLRPRNERRSPSAHWRHRRRRLP